MNIGSATQSNPISAILRPAASQPVSLDSNPSEREPDNDRDDMVAKVEPAPAKPLPAAVGKGLGLLIDVSY